MANPSAIDPITIMTLTDNLYGNIATLAGSTCGALIGTTLQPGQTSAPCTFTGTFTGVAPASQTDMRVNGVDSNGFPATATANAKVMLTPLTAPQIAVTKAAAPASAVAPGGTFTFAVQVESEFDDAGDDVEHEYDEAGDDYEYR
ncbi:MAG: hypothetical protein LC713_01505 [Actinobacteria bacterium]|nr:hypothetical protein [Actinomycetota bacterium]